MHLTILRHTVRINAWIPLMATVCLWATAGVVLSAPEEDTQGNDFDNVDIVDASLNAKLSVERVGSERTTTNLLAVFAGLKNKTARILKIEVQTIYKDRSGHPLSQGTGSWISLKLKPHEEMEYRSASISEDAVDFMVRIRREAPPAEDIP